MINENFIQGWNILSDSFNDAVKVIKFANNYNINQIQLSHHIVMDLRDVKNEKNRSLANTLTKVAHENEINEVLLWDHTLYELDYYPDKFKLSGKDIKSTNSNQQQKINLDDPQFWNWVQNDYRKMLNLAPDIDGLVLTFIETGARAEDQFSKKMSSKAEKLAKVVNKVTEVVVDEFNLNLYLRIFSYTRSEYKFITKSLEMVKNDDLPVIMKEAPHDFFLTHPNSKYAGKINRPTIIEFDTAGEFNGQGIIANTWPEYIEKRWSDYKNRPNIKGYVARTDRFNNTRIIGQPSEINLYALKQLIENEKNNSENIYDDFIIDKYSNNALSGIKAAFQKSFDIITSSLYTLGTNVANHSAMNFEPYSSSYARHVSGKWLDNPEVFVEHNVNEKFHYWKDIIDHIAPPHLKRKKYFKEEAPEVVENDWINYQKELMNWEYFNYIITEKEYGVKLAENALENIIKTKPQLNNDQYVSLFHYFNRTLLTTKLYKDVAKAYYGYRIFARGKEHRNPQLLPVIWEGLNGINKVSEQIKNYPVKPPSGQWNWVSDAQMAENIYNKILNGWKEYDYIIVPEPYDY